MTVKRKLGILSLVQMSRLHLYKGYYLGTGLLTVVGTSFATLSTASSVGLLLYCFPVGTVLTSSQIFDALYSNGTCSSTTASDGTVTRDACPDAYGMLIGTFLFYTVHV